MPTYIVRDVRTVLKAADERLSKMSDVMTTRAPAVLSKEPANKRKYVAVRNLQNLHRLANHRFTPLVQGVGVIDELLHDFNDLFSKLIFNHYSFLLQVAYNLGVIAKASHFQKFPESNPNLLEFFQPFSHIHFPIVIFWDHTKKSFQVQYLTLALPLSLSLALVDLIKDATDVDISTINLVDNTSDVDIVEVKVV